VPFQLISNLWPLLIADGVRLREEHRRRDQRSYSSRRSSTDSSEEGFNLNIRDLKVAIISYRRHVNKGAKIIV
jgi:hypothetical protein